MYMLDAVCACAFSETKINFDQVLIISSSARFPAGKMKPFIGGVLLLLIARVNCQSADQITCFVSTTHELIGQIQEHCTGADLYDVKSIIAMFTDSAIILL